MPPLRANTARPGGILLHDPARMEITIEEGFTFIAVGSDGGAVAAGLRTFLEMSRQGMTAARMKQ